MGSKIIVTLFILLLVMDYNYSADVDLNSTHTVSIVKIKEPHGNPSSTAGANSTNEITYTAGANPTLTVVCKAENTPNADKLRWKIDDIGSIKAKWTPHVTGDEYTGKGLNATAKYTGMPANYYEFGRKAISLSMAGSTLLPDEAVIEVFFMRDETNNPGGTNPNWFYYWLQTVDPLGIPAPTFIYGTSSYFTPGTRNITLSDGDKGSYNAPYGTNNPLTGIDNFAWTVIHESQHYEDWLNFWNNDPTDWRTNHRGKVGPDDDKDGDRIPNATEDVNRNGIYDAGDLYDWEQLNTPTPGRPAGMDNDFNDWDCKRHTGQKGDHDADWADPGMQHKTLDKYND